MYTRTGVPLSIRLLTYLLWIEDTSKITQIPTFLQCLPHYSPTCPEGQTSSQIESQSGSAHCSTKNQGEMPLNVLVMHIGECSTSEHTLIWIGLWSVAAHTWARLTNMLITQVNSTVNIYPKRKAQFPALVQIHIPNRYFFDKLRQIQIKKYVHIFNSEGDNSLEQTTTGGAVFTISWCLQVKFGCVSGRYVLAKGKLLGSIHA